MPQEAKYGQRFAQDMRRIREARNLTVGDLHDETKIPLGLIEAFEDKALFDHPQFNRVYLRSFVRTYAQVVGIDSDIALDALEEALAGTYAGSLAVAYLGEEPAEIPVEEEEPPGGVDEDGADATPADLEAGTEGGAAAPTEREPSRTAGDSARAAGAAPEAPDRAEEGPSFVSTTQSTAAGYRKTHAEGDVEEPVEEDWAAQSPPSGRRASRSGSSAARFEQRSGPDRRLILGAGLVVVLGALVWMLVVMTGSSEDAATDPVAGPDTAGTLVSPDTAASPPMQAVDVPPLGDTMHVRIVAAHGKVDPIRVTVDQDLRRPYWIEEGDSMTFDAAQRIVIEELLDSVAVKIEGIEYPTSRRDQQGRLVITRDTAEAYFSSLRGTP